MENIVLAHDDRPARIVEAKLDEMSPAATSINELSDIRRT
jgi:hypothetical protein